jgi:hypothetical protein
MRPCVVEWGLKAGRYVYIYLRGGCGVLNGVFAFLDMDYTSYDMT